MSGFMATKLDGSMMPESEPFPEIPVFDNLPQPLNYRVLVLPKDIDKQSAGGIIIPDEVVDSQQHYRMLACVVAVGPTAFTHKDLALDDIQVGTWVWVPKYRGQWIHHMGILQGQRVPCLLQIINDADILARFDEGLKGVIAI